MGPGWEFQKKDGLIAYKAFIVPLFSYAGPVFYPIHSNLKAPVDRFQAVQNAALCMSTGCHAVASVQHLHDECKVMPVADHLSMQCAQLLANSRTASHPSYEVTSRPHGNCPTMKPTFQNCFHNCISVHERDGYIPESNYKKVV
jgi:hypothetical protein